MSQDERERAVVIGGSIAGLLTAQALTERFCEVVIVERDRLPSGAEHRRGVPQARQIHALLAGGQQAVEGLLPGITAALARRGALVGDPLRDMQVCFDGHRFRQGASGLTLVSASRDLLEHSIRRRVLATPEVTLLDRCDVVGLTTDPSGVTGVRVLRHADHSVEEVIAAGLVVDAAGRGSRLSTWLTDLGYSTPPVEQAHADLAYATRCYHLPSDALDGDYGAIIAPVADRPRGLALARLEDRWMLTLIGMRGDHPPVSADGFDQCLTTVADLAVGNAVRAGEPLDNPVSFRFPTSQRRRYEHVQLPAHLLVLGDSLCSFNPVYGQGITVAAREAQALRHRLARKHRVDCRQLMRTFASIVDVPWAMTQAADRPFLRDAPVPTRGERMLSAHIGRVQQAATHDVTAGAALLRVTGLVDHPRSLLRPAVVARAWRPTRRPPTANGCPSQQPASTEEASCT